MCWAGRALQQCLSCLIEVGVDIDVVHVDVDVDVVDVAVDVVAVDVEDVDVDVLFCRCPFCLLLCSWLNILKIPASRLLCSWIAL